ncbi:hypothetical protein EJ03DRAFT_167510 [Teratosphaeria nubilosa]|uniref:RING-type domain-containing protein n=1 Tax=Teratosphaeria nubilosa TaxID=161662 RepID=A0A6G1L3P3_9PEZI|nr:hypothetical protein EJ03DRAFT_167510 [Teratosphaeria nubilosa]
MQDADMISAFESHHPTQIIYPALDILDWLGLRNRDVQLLPPVNAANRYEPLPLIQDRAVTANANRDSDGECAFVSITKASCEDDRAEFTPPTYSTSAVPSLLTELRKARRYPGKTVLKVLTSCSGSTVLVHVVYKIEMRDISRVSCAMPEGLCTFEISELEAARDGDQWLIDLKGLIGRSTDHAVRHVRAQLDGRRGVDLRDVNIAWKPRRHPPYRANIRRSPRFRILSPEDLREDERSCVICGDNYASDNETAVELPYGKHHMCMTCLIQWSQSKGAQDANCHSCRSRISEGTELESLQFGTSATDPKAYNIEDEGNQHYK